MEVMDKLRVGSGGEKMTHDAKNWHFKLWRYYPPDYSPTKYHELTAWWMDKIPPRGQFIMEVGCWSGLALAWLKINYPEKDIIGIDLNPEVVHMAKTRMFYLNIDVPIYSGDSFDLSIYPDQSKDLIFSDGLVEHYTGDERIKMLKEQLRVAKKVLLTVPLKETLEKGGGYGDEYRLTCQEWSSFFNKHFIVEEEFVDEEFGNTGNYGCILSGVKQ